MKVAVTLRPDVTMRWQVSSIRLAVDVESQPLQPSKELNASGEATSATAELWTTFSVQSPEVVPAALAQVIPPEVTEPSPVPAPATVTRTSVLTLVQNPDWRTNDVDVASPTVPGCAADPSRTKDDDTAVLPPELATLWERTKRVEIGLPAKAGVGTTRAVRRPKRAVTWVLIGATYRSKQ